MSLTCFESPYLLVILKRIVEKAYFDSAIQESVCLDNLLIGMTLHNLVVDYIDIICIEILDSVHGQYIYYVGSVWYGY